MRDSYLYWWVYSKEVPLRGNAGLVSSGEREKHIHSYLLIVRDTFHLVHQRVINRRSSSNASKSSWQVIFL